MNLENEAWSARHQPVDLKRREAHERDWSIWSVDELQAIESPLFSPAVVALGTFDGVHRGHQQILGDACALAREVGGTPVALTFDRHPQQTLAPHLAPRLLSSFQRRIELIRAAGIKHSIVARFDPAFARVEASDFLDRVVLGALGAAGVVVGFNFRFGKGARGDASLLTAASQERGFRLEVVSPVEYDGEHVSSTRIRSKIEAGDVAAAARLLGRPFALPGKVVRGDARGRALGYPTANLEPDPDIAVPGDGVYVTEISVVSEWGRTIRQGLTVIGTRPSFGTLERTVESFLLDFEGDLYGAEIEVGFLLRLRDVVRFDSVQALTEQIARDVSQARAFFADRPSRKRR